MKWFVLGALATALTAGYFHVQEPRHLDTLPSWTRYNLSVLATDWCKWLADTLTPASRCALAFQKIYWEATILQGLMEHDLMDAVDGKTECGTIAAELSLDLDFACRFLRGGTAMGLLRDVTSKSTHHTSLIQRVYAVTPLGAYFQTHHAKSVANLYKAMNSDLFRQALHATASKSIKSGQFGVKEAFGMEIFEFLSMEEHLSDAQIFDSAMNQISNKIAEALVKDWKTPRNNKDLVVCDLGGGKGTIIAALSQEHAHLKGILMETPGPAKRARDYISQAGLADRIQVVEGDFFQELPMEMASCNVFYLKAVFHDWGDQDCVRIIQNIRRVAQKPGAMIVGHDLMLDVGDAKYLEDGKTQFDVCMMSYCQGGRERTLDEYFHLFQQAGISNQPRLIKLRELTAIVEVDLD